MGNDGGTIPTRREILKFNSQELHQARGKGNDSLNSELEVSKTISKWKHCGLSSRELFPRGKTIHDPIVSDYLGRLYLKEEILEYILSLKEQENFDKEKKYDNVKHIRSMKDIVELKFSYDNKTGKVQCPLTSKIIDFESKSLEKGEQINRDKIPDFVYLIPCGCVMDKKILFELIKSSLSSIYNKDKDLDFKCPVCEKETNTLNVIDINSNDIEIQGKLKNRIEKLKKQGLTHSLKSKKKEKKRKSQSENDEVKRVKLQ